MFVDLDKLDEIEIDIVKLDWISYEIWEVTIDQMMKIWQVDLSWKTGVYEQRREIVKDILFVRNPNVDINNIWRDKIEAFIRYLIEKIRSQNDKKKI